MADFNSLFNYKNSLFEFVRELLCKPLKTPSETAGSQSQTPQSPKIRCIFPGNREIRISETGSLVTASSRGESCKLPVPLALSRVLRAARVEPPLTHA